MPAQGMKWRVNRAVCASTLPPPSRLVMFVLSDRADARTAVIPDERTPSLAELASDTGLGEATVKRHLAGLEAAGWVERTRPSAEQQARHVASGYRLLIGSGGSERAPAEGSQKAPAGSPERAPETGPGAQSEPTGGSERATAGAQSGPPSYKTILNDPYDQKLPGEDSDEEPTDGLFPPPPAAAKPRGPQSDTGKPPKTPKHERADALADAFWEHHKAATAQPFLAVRGVIRTALANGLDRDDVARALDRLAKEGRAISGGSLTTALGQIRTPANGGSGHAAWRNPTDPSVYYEAI